MTTLDIGRDKSTEKPLFDLVRKIKFKNPKAKVCVEVNRLEEAEKIELRKQNTDWNFENVKRRQYRNKEVKESTTEEK